MTDACPKCGEPGGAKYRHVCSKEGIARQRGQLPAWQRAQDELRRSGRGLAFRLLTCDTCRAVWPTERDEAHGGSRLDGEPCAYTAYGSAPCRGHVWPDHGHRSYAPGQDPWAEDSGFGGRQRREGEWRAPSPTHEGDGAWCHVLGLPRGTKDIGAVRRAYRKLAKELHPDVGGDTARMAQVNDAYAAALSELGQP